MKIKAMFIALVAVTPFVYTAPVETVTAEPGRLKMLSKVERFQNDPDIRFHLSCKWLNGETAKI